MIEDASLVARLSYELPDVVRLVNASGGAEGGRLSWEGDAELCFFSAAQIGECQVQARVSQILWSMQRHEVQECEPGGGMSM